MDESKYLDVLGDVIEIDGQALSLSVLSIIAKRMGMIDENTTYEQVRIWLTSDNEEVLELLNLSAQMMKEHSKEYAQPFADDTKTWSQQYYEAVGITPSGVADEAFNTGMNYLDNTIDHLTNSSVVGILDRSGNLQPFEDVYKSEVDNIIRGFSTGQNTQDEIKKAAQRLSESGLRVQYESGRTMNVYSAVRQSAITDVGRAVQDMRTAMGYEFGADGVEISAHSLCAPDHLPYQGRQYSNEEFANIQSSLKRPIARGYNCHHTTFPIIMDVSSKAYTESELSSITKNSERDVSFVRDEKEYTMTAYEGTQYMRQMENSIRKAKMNQRIYDMAGVDTTELQDSVNAAIDEYMDVCEQMGLNPHTHRLDIYELSV